VGNALIVIAAYMAKNTHPAAKKFQRGAGCFKRDLCKNIFFYCYLSVF